MDWWTRHSCRCCYHYCGCRCCIFGLCTSTHCGRSRYIHFLRLGDNPWYFYLEKNYGKEDRHQVIIKKKVLLILPLFKPVVGIPLLYNNRVAKNDSLGCANKI